MERQRNRPQMKGQENFPEEKDEMEASNLSDRKFTVMIIRISIAWKKNTNNLKKGTVRNKEFNI